MNIFLSEIDLITEFSIENLELVLCYGKQGKVCSKVSGFHISDKPPYNIVLFGDDLSISIPFKAFNNHFDSYQLLTAYLNERILLQTKREYIADVLNTNNMSEQDLNDAFLTLKKASGINLIY